ncbi:unnamed protein product [Orchesella dallaii]|uniref:G-protein coupled receptors family 2 profile 2 domain-containing protein n=1 Tax=Orchesella dallaii TaxID=48710 RepID=A0ABP1R8A6_9HEXA
MAVLIWILCFTIFTVTLSKVAATSDSNSQDEQRISLRNCCLNNSSEILNSVDSNCTEHFLISWIELQRYRVPVKNPSKISTVVNAGLLAKEKLKCEDTLEFTVPKLNESEALGAGRYLTFLSDDGHFQYGQNVYSPKEYCINRITPEEVSILGCNQTFTKNLPYVHRCCNYGEVWDLSLPGTTVRCSDSGAFKWKPKLYEEMSSDIIRTTVNDINGPLILSTHPIDLKKAKCKLLDHSFQSPSPKMDLKKGGDRPFKILSNGDVWMKLRKREWVQLDPDEYCVDGIQYGERNYSGNNDDSVLFECKQFDTKEVIAGRERQRRYSFIFGLILTFCICFLALTVLVYILLWSSHNIHGWTVFSYILALLLTYLMFGISHFASLTLERKGKYRSRIWTFCGVIGVLCHFSFLYAFSWSTVLNFDLWCTFRRLKPTSTMRSSGVRKFIAYNIVAFSFAASILCLGIGLDVMYRDDVYSDIITPEYGRIVCYVEPRYARFLFVILPVAVLLGINLFLFCNTAYAVYNLKKSAQFASTSSTKKKASHQTFRLLMKLLVINGTIWIAEIFSWYFQTDYEEVGALSFIVDVVNVMQAVAIFFLFVFKNDILEALRRKYPRLKGFVNFAFKLKQCGKKSPNSKHSRDSVTVSAETVNSKVSEKSAVRRQELPMKVLVKAENHGG